MGSILLKILEIAGPSLEAELLKELKSISASKTGGVATALNTAAAVLAKVAAAL